MILEVEGIPTHNPQSYLRNPNCMIFEVVEARELLAETQANLADTQANFADTQKTLVETQATCHADNVIN